jgi:dUTP pyrophosphatase
MRTLIRVKRLPHAQGLPLPRAHSEHAAGMDVCAAVGEALTLAPGDWAAVPTGLCFELPTGHEMQVRPRSGLALRHGVTVLNAPGTIDADYRGQLQVLLINHGREPYEIRRGERIAQLVISSVTQAELVEVDDLGDSARGEAGFGSTGR